MEGITGEPYFLLETAAFFHDLGFIEQAQDHEAASIRMARQALPEMGFSAQQIEVIRGLIQATVMPQQPTTRLEEIIADADLESLGRDDFYARSQDLRVELAAYGSVVPMEEWCARQLQFLRSHRYFTASARLLYDAQKRRNLQDLQRRLDARRAIPSSSPPVVFAVGTKTLSAAEVLAILRSVSIFAETPDEILNEIVSLFHPLEYAPGQVILQKGDLGDCMYMIMDGRVRIYDGDWTINVLGAGDVFGEMSLLDSAPRMASVMALEKTHVLRLDQAPFYELMSSHSDVVRGVIRVLLRHLRSTVRGLK
jgi:uncharacterized protein